MRLTKYHIALTFGAFFLLSYTLSWGTNISTGRWVELAQQSKHCGAPSIIVKTEQHGLPFSKNGADHSGAGSKYIGVSDAVPHVSVTAISSLTFAIVIALVNNDQHDPPARAPAVQKLTVFHKVLFCSIIAPNAP